MQLIFSFFWCTLALHIDSQSHKVDLFQLGITTKVWSFRKHSCGST